MRKTKKLDLSKCYSFPAELQTVHYGGHIIIIAPLCLSWIVLDNCSQLRLFHLLKSHHIADAIMMAGASESDVRHTLTQIEARGFCDSREAHSVKDENTSHMQFFLTDGCNLRCPHCLMRAAERGDDELSTTEVYNVLEAFKSNGGRVVTFSGGEIALRQDISDILHHCLSLGLKADLLTNGTLWDEALVERVAACLGRVQISIDGFSEESNARIRGKGSFAKSLRAVDLFVRAGVKVEVAVTPMLNDSLEDDAPRFVAWAKELKRMYHDYDFSFRFTGELIDGRNVQLTPEEQERYGRIMTSIHDGYWGGDSEAESFISFVKSRELRSGCTFGSFNVSANGDIYACGRVAGMRPLANVRRDNLAEIFRSLRRLTRLSQVENLSPCKGCELRYFCGGKCRIKYFDAFIQLDDLSRLPEPAQLVRDCPSSVKEHFYRLMLDANERLFA
ncbi:MAG: radical SAM protein [Marinilabiliaceae bacterium]